MVVLVNCSLLPLYMESLTDMISVSELFIPAAKASSAKSIVTGGENESHQSKQLSGATSASIFPVLVGHHTQVFYIAETLSGGSLKYVQDLIKNYGGTTGIPFHRLPSKAAADAAATLFHENDILLFQYLLYTDFTFDDVANMVRRFRLRLIIPIHDKYFLDDNPGADLVINPSVHFAEPAAIPSDKLVLLHLAEFLIFPSDYIRNVFLKYIDLPSMVVVPHIDQPLHRYLSIPPLMNDTIRVGIITSPTFCKGLDIWEGLFRITMHQGKRVNYYLYSNYKNIQFPEVVVRGAYQENEIYCILEEDNIHGLLFLNRYPETYSYALTKGINSGRPLLYTRMGAVAERLARENQPEKYIVTDNTDVEQSFSNLLDFIAAHAGEHSGEDFSMCIPTAQDERVIQPEFYNNLFKQTM